MSETQNDEKPSAKEWTALTAIFAFGMTTLGGILILLCFPVIMLMLLFQKDPTSPTEG